MGPAAFGLLAKTPEGASGFSFFVMFLPYPSSAFVPIDAMPTWLHGFAEHQPATPVIETLRGLLMGAPIGDGAWLAIAWCTGITAVALAATGVLFRRRTACAAFVRDAIAGLAMAAAVGQTRDR